MKHLIYSKQAERDLNSIALYIIRESGFRKTALNFTTELRKKYQRLSELSGTFGRTRPELGHGLRSLAHKSYVIFFRYLDDTVEIVTILHGSRDIDSHFGAE